MVTCPQESHKQGPMVTKILSNLLKKRPVGYLHLAKEVQRKESAFYSWGKK